MFLADSHGVTPRCCAGISMLGACNAVRGECKTRVRGGHPRRQVGDDLAKQRGELGPVAGTGRCDDERPAPVEEEVLVLRAGVEAGHLVDWGDVKAWDPPADEV